MPGRRSGALALALVLAAGGPAAALTGEIVAWGVTEGRRQAAPARPSPGERGLSPATELRGVRYLERTDRIEARLCRNFGISVRLSGSTEPMPRRVEVRVLHPQFTRPDGATSTEDRFRSDVVDGVTHVGFGFDHPYEMQPGAWTVSVSVRGTEIARKDFTVVVTPGAPSECGTIS